MPRPRINVFKTDEERKAYRREVCKRFRERHPDRIKESHKKDYEKHKVQKSEYAKRYYVENKDAYLSKHKEYEQRPDVKTRRMGQKKVYYQQNKEHISARNKKYQSEHAEYLKQTTKEYRKLHPEVLARAFEKYNKTEKAKERYRRYSKNHPGKRAAQTAKQRAALIKRTPSYSDLKAIAEFYAKKPEGYEVDHIIPLRGKNVSGLHVLENLQYLTEKENGHKLAKFNFDEYKETQHFKNWMLRVNKAIDTYGKLEV